MSLRLRDFIYLDADLVERLLSQVEGGVSSEEERTDSAKTDKKRGAGIRAAPATAEIGRTMATETSASKKVRQTSDSACSRLIEMLEAEDSLQFLETFDQNIWEQLKRGEALEIEASVELSIVAQFGGIADAFESVAAVMESAGQPVDVDAEGLAAFKAFSMLSGNMKTLPVLARPIGASQFTFIASLRPEALRLGQDQINGEATVFGTLQRRLRTDESWSIFDAMGFAGLPRELRGQIEQSLQESEGGLGGMLVKPPAALLNPIAIYR